MRGYTDASLEPATSMKPNPDYVRAMQQSVHSAPYPALIGMTIDELDIDRCRIGLELRRDSPDTHPVLSSPRGSWFDAAVEVGPVQRAGLRTAHADA